MIERWRNEDTARTMVSKFNKLVDACNKFSDDVSKLQEEFKTLKKKAEDISVTLQETQDLINDLLVE